MKPSQTNQPQRDIAVINKSLNGTLVIALRISESCALENPTQNHQSN